MRIWKKSIVLKLKRPPELESWDTEALLDVSLLSRICTQRGDGHVYSLTDDSRRGDCHDNKSIRTDEMCVGTVSPQCLSI